MADFVLRTGQFFLYLAGIPLAVANDHGISPKRNNSQPEVNIIFNGKKNKLTEDVPFSSYVDDFNLRTGQFFLNLAGRKLFQLVTIDRVMKDNRLIN